MIKSITFKEDYDYLLEKESQKRFKVKTIRPTKYSREKKPYKMFTIFPKGLKIEFNSGVNVIVGDNGSGKSTLFSMIKAYSGKPIDDFTLSFSKYETHDQYQQDYQKDYNGELEVEGEINYTNAIYFDAEKDNPVVAIPKMLNPDSRGFPSMVSLLFDANEESHGESMIPVLEYILGNASGCTIFMDEPETALSLRKQIWLTKELQKSAKKRNNQIIISTHALAVINQFEIVYDMETRKWVDRKEYVDSII